MSDPNTSAPDRWQQIFAQDDLVAAFASTEHGIASLWTPLGVVADASTGEEKTGLQALAKVASLWPRADDWNMPYAPAIQMQEGRTFVPGDLTPEELSLLAEMAPCVPHAGLRARALDVLSFLSDGAERVRYAQLSIDALLSEPIVAETWMTDHAAWDRALAVAQRYGVPTRGRVAKIERHLRAIIRSHSEGFVPLRAADLLTKYRLANDRADGIARRLHRLASTFQSEQRRAYLRGATTWFARAGNEDQAAQLMADDVQSLIDEAEVLAADDSNAFRAAHLYEEALQRVRRIPGSQRRRLTVTHLSSTIARRIRELGALSLGSMAVFEYDPIDLSDAVRDSRNRVKGLSVEEALLAFTRLGSLVVIDKEIEDAKQQLNEHPLQGLFSNLHMSRDGRVTHRSGGRGGVHIYGIDPAVWDAIMRTFDLRVNLMAQGVLFPAWTQLTNEHRMTLADFVTIVSNTGIVPPEHFIQFARALYYGFDGDFSTAMQLLAPQMESLVRFHLADAGVTTSNIDDRTRTEKEIGLTGLMEKPEVEEIFGRDLAFTIRMLFCGPLGPNIRNDTAHGLVSDQNAMGSAALYSWWFALKVVFMSFWNSLHDTEMAEAREPAQPGERAEAKASET